MNASVMIKLDTMIPFFVLFGCLMILMIHLYHSYQTQPGNLSLNWVYFWIVHEGDGLAHELVDFINL